LRQSREAAAETRERIIKVAARQFRKHGIGGISVADVMAKAGLTHGGFYKHFRSKDELAAEACRRALAAARDELATAAMAAPKGRGLEAILDIYLSMNHRDHPERGCIIAALAGETARLGPPTREAVAEGIEALAALIASQVDAGREISRLQRARGILSTMVGALTLARNVSDREAADAALRSARAAALSWR
jgi:TetR/AcrR family transcriptional repressor of nem operon